MKGVERGGGVVGRGRGRAGGEGRREEVGKAISSRGAGESGQSDRGWSLEGRTYELERVPAPWLALLEDSAVLLRLRGSLRGEERRILAGREIRKLSPLQRSLQSRTAHQRPFQTSCDGETNVPSSAIPLPLITTTLSSRSFVSSLTDRKSVV